MAHLHQAQQSVPSKVLSIPAKYKQVNEGNENDAKASFAEECIDLVGCSEELHFNPHLLKQEIEKNRALLSKLSTEIKPVSRRNYELEKLLATMEKQIELFKQNIITADDIGGIFVQHEQKTEEKQEQLQDSESPLNGKKKCINNYLVIYTKIQDILHV